MLAPPALQRIVFALVTLAVLVGVWARVYRLDRKLFWQDEAVAALHVSGHSLVDVRRLFDGRVHRRAEVAALLERAPGSNLGTTLDGLAHEDAHLAPLFYVFDRFALEAAGHADPSTYRLPSVVAGLVSIGFAFALGTTLFGSRLGGGVLAALVAVSPFQILYARQTREYALFATLVLASSYYLLRALERRSGPAWLAYGISVALGLYADSLFGLVMVAHAVVAVALLHARPRQLGAYVAAGACGALTFVPWALHGVRAEGTVSNEISWAATAYPLKFFAEKWFFNIAAVFFDAEFGALRLAVVAALVLAIVLCAAVSFARFYDARVRLLGYALAAIPMGAFLALDVLHRSHFSTIARYLVAGWVGLDVIVAGALAAGIARRSPLAVGAFAALVAAGAYSAVVDNAQANWWDNNDHVPYQAVAAAIDAAAPRPLVLAGAFDELPLVLAPYLTPQASFLLGDDEHVPSLPAGTAHAYLITPAPEVLAKLRARSGARYRTRNVSPGYSDAANAFRAQLTHDPAYAARDGVGNQRPDNALWAFDLRT